MSNAQSNNSNLTQTLSKLSQETIIQHINIAQKLMNNHKHQSTGKWPNELARHLANFIRVKLAQQIS